jgi:hypothetical protein
MDLVDVVTRFILPPLLGGAGGLITVYANWGIEKQRQRLARRRELVTGWRMNLLPMLGEGEIDWGTQKGKILASPFYASLRPHLSAKLVNDMRSERVIFVGGDFPRTALIE